MSASHFKIESLGAATLKSPIQLFANSHFTSDDERLLFDPHFSADQKAAAPSAERKGFELAGPREKIYFNPKKTKAAIVTCGGLCPGLNAVIRALVFQLYYRYEVRNIVGVRFGFAGLGSDAPEDFMELSPEKITDIHEKGGTILGTTRGTPKAEEIVSSLEKYNINVLFCIGGDGTMRGTLEIAKEARKRGLKISVIGIPKTIDNDIPFVRRSFGFESAVALACQAVNAAHEEARGTRHGVGLVKLMGRNSGYIAANTAIATSHADFCLVPEVPFGLDGANGLLKLIEKKLQTRGHTLIVVAEGAGQEFFEKSQKKEKEKDASGNAKLGDIGIYLKDAINAHFAKKKLNIALKYIGPSYLIRATPPNTTDLLFCARLAQCAVHAAMAGKTDLLIGYWHGEMTHVPLTAVNAQRQTINPSGKLWFNVIESTGQPTTIG